MYTWTPELHQNMLYLSPYHRPVPISAKFRENIEIPRKWANSAARLKIPPSAENCGPSRSVHPSSHWTSSVIVLKKTNKLFCAGILLRNGLMGAESCSSCTCSSNRTSVVVVHKHNGLILCVNVLEFNGTTRPPKNGPTNYVENLAIIPNIQ